MLKKDKPVGKNRKSDHPSLLETLLACPKLPRHESRLVFGDRRRTTLQTAHFKRWQLQEAKAKFSEVFNRAISEAPRSSPGEISTPSSSFPRKSSENSLMDPKRHSQACLRLSGNALRAPSLNSPAATNATIF